VGEQVVHVVAAAHAGVTSEGRRREGADGSRLGFGTVAGRAEVSHARIRRNLKVLPFWWLQQVSPAEGTVAVHDRE